MSNIASAGTMISSVLQTAGLISQARILEDFQNFFQSGGALLYVIAGIGGVISMALYNSFRMARYLLIGPGLFWFLVAPTTEVGGVAWQLGGGKPRTPFAYSTSIESAEFAKKVAYKNDKSIADPELEAKKPINISLFFNFYTGVINKFVTEAENVILRSEDDEQLMFVGRTRALEAIVNSEIESPELIEMLEGNLFNECGRMMQAALRLSKSDISKRTVEDIEKEAAAASANGQKEGVTASYKLAQGIKKTRKHYQREYDRGKLDMTKPNRATQSFMSRYQDRPGATQNVMKKIKDNNPTYAGKKVEDLGSALTMSCSDLWLINLQAIFVHAAKLEKVLNQKMPVNLEKDPVARKKFCNTLARKFSEEGVADNQQCDLVQTMGIFLIKNSLKAQGLSRIAKRHQEAVQPIMRPKRNSPEILNEAGQQIPVAGGADGYQTQVVKEPGLRGETASVKVLGADGGMHRFSNVGEVSDHLSASFGQHLNYQTQELKQNIFTAALNFPYYQGLLLYFLSIAYPFTCLLVLIPGRATTFLSIPLFWLWIKSWNVAFAMVMVFDRVIWNLFPHSELPLEICDSSMSDCKYDLPDILAEAFKDDPLYHVHSYYYLLSLAIFSIPAITGYATVKGRKAILASFTQGIENAVEEVGEKSGGLYGLSRINKVSRDYKSFLAQAQSTVGPQGSGFLGGGQTDGRPFEERAKDIIKPDLMSMTTALMGGDNMTRGEAAGLTALGASTPDLFTSKRFSAVPKTMNKVGMDLLEAAVNRDMAKAGLFHPLGSASGGHASNAAAEMGAVDGGGGMEIAQGMGEVSGAASENIKYQSKVLGTIADTLGNAIAKAPGAFGVAAGIEGLTGTAVVAGGAYGMSRSDDNTSESDDFFDFISGRPDDSLNSFTDQVYDAHYDNEEEKKAARKRLEPTDTE